MSENVKRVFAHPEDYVWDDLVTDVHRACWTEFVPASDYDALLAERDALMEAGDRMAKWCEPTSVPTGIDPDEWHEAGLRRLSEALAAWRAATGEDKT